MTTSLWPLLVDDPMSGDHLILRQLRPAAAAHAVDIEDFEAARRALIELCGTWNGCAMPLLPVVQGGSLQEPWVRIVMESSVDGIADTELLHKDELARFNTGRVDGMQLLLRILVEVDPLLPVRTCRGVDQNDPWYLAYLATLGDLPSRPSSMNTWNELREDYTYQDLLTIEETEGPAGATNLVDQIRDFNSTTAVALSRSRLDSMMQAPINKSLPEDSRFHWDDDRIARKFGPNIIVVYEPGRVEDLALIWNLRARFGHPASLPLAVPFTESAVEDLHVWQRLGVQRHFGFGHDVAITSLSVAEENLKDLAQEMGYEVVSAHDLLRPIDGYCVLSNEVAHFTDGEAKVPSFTTTDSQALGSSFLAGHQATWMKLQTIVVDDVLPPSRTMRKPRWDMQSEYRQGYIARSLRPTTFKTLRHPSGLDALKALASDRDVTMEESEAGRAAEYLIRACKSDLSMLASPGAAKVIYELARGRHVSLVKRRLNDFLKDDGSANPDRYQELLERLDRAVGSPDTEELDYLTFNKIQTSLGVGQAAARHWMGWALECGVVLRGVEAKCDNCGHKQWRPLAETVPNLICHGCEHPIANPHGFNHIEYRYRASEVLLRAITHDVLPYLLSLRYLSRLLGGRSAVFGGYPGANFRRPGAPEVFAEADVLVVLRNGSTIAGECKMRARGLNKSELEKIWLAGERLNATATFAATLDPSEACSTPEWNVTESPSGRPHFSLTAEHLFDLGCRPTAYGQEMFSWRASSEFPDERELNTSFGRYLERRDRDYRHETRAPWRENPD